MKVILVLVTDLSELCDALTRDWGEKLGITTTVGREQQQSHVNPKYVNASVNNLIHLHAPVIEIG